MWDVEGEDSIVCGALRVVLRWRLVVSALGGGGREIVSAEGRASEERDVFEGVRGRSVARQRKHSPVP